MNNKGRNIEEISINLIEFYLECKGSTKPISLNLYNKEIKK